MLVLSWNRDVSACRCVQVDRVKAAVEAARKLRPDLRLEGGLGPGCLRITPNSDMHLLVVDAVASIALHCTAMPC